MKKKILLLSFTVITLTACSHLASNQKDRIIVGTYNIDAKVIRDTDKQRELMAKNHVEIFGVQEVNYNNKRFADQAIARYNPLPTFKKAPYDSVYYGNAINFAGGGYGIATVSSLPLVDKTTNKLVITNAAKQYANTFAAIYTAYDPTKPESVKAMNAMSEKGGISTKGAMEPRVYTRVVFEKNGKKVAFYNTHLSYETQAIRQKQMQQLLTAMKNDPLAYTIAVGDFNADQSTKEFDVWRHDFNMVNGGKGIWYDTFIEKDDAMNVNSIDNIIVSKNITITSIKYENEKLSDHLPLIAELELH